MEIIKLKKTVKQSDINEEIHYKWECPECYAVNVDELYEIFPFESCECYSCGKCFDVEE